MNAKLESEDPCLLAFVSLMIVCTCADVKWSMCFWRWIESYDRPVMQWYENPAISSMPFLPLPRVWGGAAVKKTPNMELRRRKYWSARRNSGTPQKVQGDKQRDPKHADASLGERAHVTAIQNSRGWWVEEISNKLNPLHTY